MSQLGTILWVAVICFVITFLILTQTKIRKGSFTFIILLVLIGSVAALVILNFLPASFMPAI